MTNLKGELVITKQVCDELNDVGLSAKWNPYHNACSIDFTDANLTQSEFDGANLSLSTFRKADMTDSIFKDAKINEVQKERINWIAPETRSNFEIQMEKVIKSANQEELEKLKIVYPELVKKYKI
ncbi:MAG: pentapeptide repeat-containing protein [Candidatus Nanoarchaeia archaeon]